MPENQLQKQAAFMWCAGVVFARLKTCKILHVVFLGKLLLQAGMKENFYASVRESKNVREETQQNLTITFNS